MATLSVPVPRRPAVAGDTVADLLHALGDIPPRRVLLRPGPGTATETDVAAERQGGGRLCELVDGTLVEKARGYRESVIAAFIAHLFHAFNEGKNLGLISGADGMMRLFPGLVRIPDVAFVLWKNIPGGRMPTDLIPDLVPDLVVEILSQSNTPAEMERKRKDYLKAGAQLIWIVDPQSRTITVSARTEQPQTLRQEDVLTGGIPLPGFSVSVREIFGVLDRMQS